MHSHAIASRTFAMSSPSTAGRDKAVANIANLLGLIRCGSNRLAQITEEERVLYIYPVVCPVVVCLKLPPESGAGGKYDGIPTSRCWEGGVALVFAEDGHDGWMLGNG